MIPAYHRHRAEIAQLLDERFFPLSWVEQEIKAGRIAVFGNDAAVIGVQRREYPGGATELHAMFAAGELKAALELWDGLLACAEGFDVAAIESRSGWERVMASRGFKRDRVRIVKELR